MKRGKPGGRLIVVRHIGSMDYAEVLFNILKYYVENRETNPGAIVNSGGRQGGDRYSGRRLE